MLRRHERDEAVTAELIISQRGFSSPRGRRRRDGSHARALAAPRAEHRDEDDEEQDGEAEADDEQDEGPVRPAGYVEVDAVAWLEERRALAQGCDVLEHGFGCVSLL